MKKLLLYKVRQVLTGKGAQIMTNDLNNKERKKERSAKWHFGQFQFTSFCMVLDSRKVQLVIKMHDNEG